MIAVRKRKGKTIGELMGMMMETVKIIYLCILSAVVYGILHDQVTVRVCVEYFTVGHPPIFPTKSPTLLALGWGIRATWWVGLILGVPAALASRIGSWPKYTAARLILPIAGLLLVMACASLLAGIVGYVVAMLGGVKLLEPWASQIRKPKHNAFLADLWAHLAAYGIGFLGGFALCGLVLIHRRRMASKAKRE